MTQVAQIPKKAPVVQNPQVEYIFQSFHVECYHMCTGRRAWLLEAQRLQVDHLGSDSYQAINHGQSQGVCPLGALVFTLEAAVMIG